MSIGPKNRCTCTLRMPGQPHEDGCAEAPCSSCAFLTAKNERLQAQIDGLAMTTQLDNQTKYEVFGGLLQSLYNLMPDNTNKHLGLYSDEAIRTACMHVIAAVEALDGPQERLLLALQAAENFMPELEGGIEDVEFDPSVASPKLAAIIDFILSSMMTESLSIIDDYD